MDAAGFASGSSAAGLDGWAVGLQNRSVLVVQDGDGSLIVAEIEGANRIMGSLTVLTALTVDGPLAFVAVHGSTNLQPSTIWLLDLRDLT